MSWLLEFVKEGQQYLGATLLHFGYAESAIIAKFALNHKISHFTFAVYRKAFVTIFFAPFALLLERKIRPKMTLSIFLKIMLLGLLSFLQACHRLELYYTGLRYTTATLATVMCNVLPALTFLLAWILRFVISHLFSNLFIDMHAKIVGTSGTFCAAMIMTMIGGLTIGLSWTRHHINIPSSPSTSSFSTHELQPIKGAHSSPEVASVGPTFTTFRFLAYSILFQLNDLFNFFSLFSLWHLLTDYIFFYIFWLRLHTIIGKFS
ncbi:WAT1-related protein [Capsicum annuum]|uniref:WAT1-related protein n=1 Tax=Capsicum annuum TaxID=4072 RepID=A0A2G2Z901_CAPAN|nr:WAT1-related protein [Capsicum annuum]